MSLDQFFVMERMEDNVLASHKLYMRDKPRTEIHFLLSLDSLAP